MSEAKRQLVDLRNVVLEGSILDIGGGGEGIIARRFGQRVAAIDRRKDELEEAPDQGLKIIMDAADLKFLDESFDNVTCFFSLMYMTNQDLAKILGEIKRVLKKSGNFWIWDTEIPLCDDIFLVHLDIALSGNETISTTYGTSRPAPQNLDSVSKLCEAIGFKTSRAAAVDNLFVLHLIKV